MNPTRRPPTGSVLVAHGPMCLAMWGAGTEHTCMLILAHTARRHECGACGDRCRGPVVWPGDTPDPGPAETSSGRPPGVA